MRRYHQKTLAAALIVTLLAAFALLAPPSFSYKGGPPVQRTGAPGEGICAGSGCHEFKAGPKDSGVLRIISPDFYMPGERYVITVRIRDPNGAGFGFELTAVGEDGKSAGYFDPRDERTDIEVQVKLRSWAEHRKPRPADDNHSAEWDVVWVAPSTDRGNVTFYSAAASVNLDSKNSGDVIYLTSATVPLSPDYTPPKYHPEPLILTHFRSLWWVYILFILLVGVGFQKTYTWLRDYQERIIKKHEIIKEMGVQPVTPFEKIWLLIFAWLDERLCLRRFIKDTARPLKTKIRAAYRQMPKSHTSRYGGVGVWFWYPLYSLGGLIIVEIIILLISGMIMGFYYIPSGETANPTGPESYAYLSLVRMNSEVPLGAVVRGVHFWTGQLFIATVILHLCRVYFTGAYRRPRELNWILGVLLLCFSIAMGYTGYLLPWDERSYLAANIGLGLTSSLPFIGEPLARLIFGGTSIGPYTVVRMYIFHTLILPGLMMFAVLIHVVLVYLHGIAEPH